MEFLRTYIKAAIVFSILGAALVVTPLVLLYLIGTFVR